MTLTELEPRDCPAPASLGSGVVRLRTGFEVMPFEDWRGPLSVMGTADRVYVGGGVGAGPRVAVFDPASGQRTQPDYFAGDPADRSGVVFVQPESVSADGPVQVPRLRAGEPDWFAVYLDYERPRSAAFVVESFDRMPGLFDGLPVRFTTERPAAPPGTYGTVVIGAPTEFYVGSLGYAPAWGWGLEPENPYRETSVYVTGTLRADYTARVAAHEIGHAFGLVHSTDDGSLMSTQPGRAFADAERNQIAARLE